MKTRLSWLLGAASVAVMAGAARADPAPAVETGSTVGEVVVTAQKRVENAQDVPATLSVLDADRLTQANVVTLFQAVTLVPGVIFSRAPDDGIALTFRGLGTLTRSSELEQSIALVEDGVPYAKGRLYSTGLFDVDQLEFVKGTESTFQGKNSSLGVINVVNRQPGDRPSFIGRAAYEVLDGGPELDAADDIPINDKVSLRLAAHYSDLDGWVHDDATNHDGPELKDSGLRAILRADLTPHLRVTASYQYADDQQIGGSMQLVGNIPAIYGDGVFDDHTSAATTHTPDGEVHHITRTHTGSVKVDWDMGWATLTSRTSVIHYDLGFVDDLDFSPQDTVTLLRSEHYDQLSQELRLQSRSGGRLEYAAGVFLLGSRWRSLEDQLWAVPNFPPPPDPTSGQLFNGPFLNDFRESQRDYSGYASGAWRVTSKLKLAGGVRYSHDEKDDVFGRTAQPPYTIWNSIANPPFDPTPLHHRADFVDGSASLQYAFRPTVTGYLSYGHGSKAGGFIETNTIAVAPQLLINGKVPAALVAANAALKDELADSYEAGIKTELFDRRLRLNVSVFKTDIADFQDTVFTGGPLGFITFNDPATSKGVDGDFAWKIGHGLSLDGGATYSDATAVIQLIDPVTDTLEFDANGKPITGRFRRSQAPKIVFNTALNYNRPLAGDFEFHSRAEVHHRSSMFNQRQEEYFSPQLTTLDVSLGVGTRRWSLDLIVRNLNNGISQDFASATPDPRFAAFYGAYAASPNRLRALTLAFSVRY